MPRRLREFDGRPRNSNGEFAGADTQGIDPMSMHMAYRQPFAPPVAPEAAEAALTPAQKKAKLEQEKKSKLLSMKQFTAIPEHERFNDAVVRAHGRFVKSGLGENRKEAERFNRQLDKAEIRLRGNTYTPEGNLAGGLVGGAAGAIASYKINPKSLPLSLILGASGGLVGAGLGGLVGSRIDKKHKTYPNGVKFGCAGKLKELSFMKNNGTYATALKELSAQRQQMIYFARGDYAIPTLKQEFKTDNLGTEATASARGDVAGVQKKMYGSLSTPEAPALAASRMAYNRRLMAMVVRSKKGPPWGRPM